MKAIHFMLSLLLKNPSKNWKAKDHLKALARRLKLCGKGDMNKLVNESNSMQGRLTFLSKSKQLMQVGKANGTLRLLTNNLSNWIILVSYEKLEKLNLKHSGAKKACIDLLLHDPRNPLHRHKDINEFFVMNSEIRTKAVCQDLTYLTSINIGF